MSLEDRNWTAFMLDAEHDHHGYRRMVSVHNALRARIAELEAERDSLRAKLLSAPEPWLDTKKIMVSDGTRDVTLHGEKYVNWYAANVAPLREGK